MIFLAGMRNEGSLGDAGFFTAISYSQSIFHFFNSHDLFIKPVKRSKENLAIYRCYPSVLFLDES